MTLENIETAILRIIGYDYYADLSTSTDSAKIADFAMLHRCVNMAREEMRINCYIPALLAYTARIQTVAGTNEYTIPETDFDLPKKVFSISVTNLIAGELERINEQNFLNKVGTEDVPSDPPSYYEMLDSTADGISKIRLYPTPNAGGDYIFIKYLKVLAEITTSTSEDILMRKYSNTVISLASAFAFQMIKKDDKNFATFMTLGRADFKNINVREANFDASPDITVDSLLSNRRSDRRTI